MKLISLNLYHGHYLEPLLSFIASHGDTTDIFCLQEVFNSTQNHQYQGSYCPDLLARLQSILTDHDSFFTPNFFGLDNMAAPVSFDLNFGKAIFVRRGITITDKQDFQLYRTLTNQVQPNWSDVPVSLQTCQLEINSKPIIIANYHGDPMPAGKLDTPARLSRSAKILELLPSDTPTILVGDFNLHPNTQSVRMLENRYKNLITQYQVATTRGSLNPYAGTPEEQFYADYTFVTPELTVNQFTVPDARISDHCPMILEFEV